LEEVVTETCENVFGVFLSVVVTFKWPDLKIFFITAYGRSPGALLRVMRLLRIFFPYI